MLALAAALASAAWTAAPAERAVDAAERRPAARTSWPPDPYPERRELERASAFAAAAPGAVAFAVTDGVRGVRGLGTDLRYSSASASKALLLAAELRRLRRERLALDAGTRSLLEPMITYSDNDAASAVYARVGDAGMLEVARAAGMRDFEPIPGYWGGAQVSAADLARFYLRLGRLLDPADLAYAKRLLGSVTPSQRWGIPAGVPGGWRVYFKGGWRPAGVTENSGSVTHQAGLLVHRSGRRVALAILTDQPPGSTSYATLAGITARLLAGDPRRPRWPYP